MRSVATITIATRGDFTHFGPGLPPLPTAESSAAQRYRCYSLWNRLLWLCFTRALNIDGCLPVVIINIGQCRLQAKISPLQKADCGLLGATSSGIRWWSICWG